MLLFCCLYLLKIIIQIIQIMQPIKNNADIFLNAWNKCLTSTQKNLEEEFKKNDQFFFRAMHYIEQHPSKLAKNIDLSAKIISCIPETHVTTISVHKILSFLQASGRFSQQATAPLIPFFGSPHPQFLNVLSDCIEKGKSSLALLLLDHGFPFTDEMLFQACEKELPKVALRLIEKGADFNAYSMNELDDTILHWACKNRFSEVALKLIERGADVNDENKLGSTPLRLACRNKLPHVALKLIEKGADVNHASKDGTTSLHWACHRRLLEVVLKLIEKGANINSRNLNGSTPLFWACHKGFSDVALKLIEKGADVDCINRFGHNPLGLSCKNKLPQVILAILKKEKKWNLNDPDQRLPLEFQRTIEAEELMHYCFEGIGFLRSGYLPGYLKGPARLEAAMLFGDEALAHITYSKMTAKEKIKALEILKQRFESNCLPAYFENLCWEINPDHYRAGKVLAEKIPQPLPGKDSITLLKQELELQEGFPKSAAIQEMITKIKSRTPIMGLGEKSDEEVKQWYDTFSLYLIHVLDAYKFGQKEGNTEDKIMILEQLADMQENCSPRWMDEIKQIYTFRPHDIAGDEPEVEISLEDKGHQLNRNLRKDIVTTKLLRLGIGNVHEPNFLLDLLGEPLDLRVGKINDPYAHYENVHSRDEAIATFNKYYTAFALIDNVTAHLQSQQSQEKTSHDPLDLKLSEVFEWLRERVAVFWRDEEYRELPSTVKRMQKEGMAPESIKAFLSEYGIEWEAGETVPEAMQRLSQQEALLASQIKQLETMLTKIPNNKALQDNVNVKVKEKESLQHLQKQVASLSSDTKKRQFLEEQGRIKKPQPLEEVLTETVRKRAQIDTFFEREVFCEGKFTRSAAIHLLISWGVLRPRSYKKYHQGR
jgi:ankyrin repeat protein